MSASSSPPPPKGGKVLPFPPPLADEPGEAQIRAAWREELSRLEQETAGPRLRLTLERVSGRQLLSFIETTGLRGLVRISEQGSRLILTSDKKTVSRLVIWQALDLGLDFSVEVIARPGQG